MRKVHALTCQAAELEVESQPLACITANRRKVSTPHRPQTNPGQPEAAHAHLSQAGSGPLCMRARMHKKHTPHCARIPSWHPQTKLNQWRPSVTQGYYDPTLQTARAWCCFITARKRSQQHTRKKPTVAVYPRMHSRGCNTHTLHMRKARQNGCVLSVCCQHASNSTPQHMQQGHGCAQHTDRASTCSARTQQPCAHSLVPIPTTGLARSATGLGRSATIPDTPPKMHTTHFAGLTWVGVCSTKHAAKAVRMHRNT